VSEPTTTAHGHPPLAAHADADALAAPTAPAAPAAPFRRRTLWILGLVIVASLATTVALTLFAGDLEGPPSAGTDAYSRSALGHHGLVTLLDRLGTPVVVSQAHSAERAKHGVLIVAEPAAGDETADHRLSQLVLGAPRVLLVLPKWWGHPSVRHEGWLSDVELLPTDEVADVLAAIGLDRARLQRGAEPIRGPVTIAHAPQTVTIDPAWDEPVLAIGDRALIVDIPHGSTTITLVTVPDLLSNHGLDEPGNAAAIVAQIDRLRAGGPVVVDEIGHGHAREPGVWAVLFRYPLVLATLQALLVAIALGLATRGRFGPPGKAPPPLAAGKDFLIRHTATLLRHGGHDAAMLRRYLAGAIAQVRAVLHAPRELSSAQAAAWLERIGAARKVSVTLADLERDVAAVEADRSRNHARHAAPVAARIHRWRQEMTLGSGNHP
jgi:hypothetical protein